MKKQKKLSKIILVVLGIIAIIGIIIYLFPYIKQLTTKEGQIAFKNIIDELGFWGPIVLIAILLVKAFLILIPGEPLEILAGMCYGTFGGLLVILISAIITTTTIMLLVRKFGRKFIYKFFKKERIRKLEKSKMFRKKKRLEWIMVLLFIIPGTPKDIIVYLAALLPINPYRFIAISVIARIPSIISSTIAGANLALGNWHISILVYVATFALVGVAMLIINKFDKTKSAEDVLKSIK